MYLIVYLFVYLNIYVFNKCLCVGYFNIEIGIVGSGVGKGDEEDVVMEIG